MVIVKKLFRNALLNFPAEEILIEKGRNIIPTIHMKDLISIISKIIEKKPDSYYIIAFDKDKNNSLLNMTKTIYDCVGDINKMIVPKEELNDDNNEENKNEEYNKINNEEINNIENKKESENETIEKKNEENNSIRKNFLFYQIKNIAYQNIFREIYYILLNYFLVNLSKENQRKIIIIMNQMKKIILN